MAYEPTSAWPPWKKRIAETIEEGYKQGDPMINTTNTPTPETVKRYEYVQDVEGGETMHPIGARWATPPNGQYVQAKDYDALETRLTAAEAELAAMRGAEPRVWTADDVRAALLEADRDPVEGESFADQLAKALNNLRSPSPVAMPEEAEVERVNQWGYDDCLKVLFRLMGAGKHHKFFAQNADGSIKSFDSSGASPSSLGGGKWFGNGMERTYRLNLPLCPEGWAKSYREIVGDTLIVREHEWANKYPPPMKEGE